LLCFCHCSLPAKFNERREMNAIVVAIVAAVAIIVVLMKVR